MKLTLEQVGEQGTQIMTIEHDKEVAQHTPDLIEFAKYCEDILYKAKFLMGGFVVGISIANGFKEFFAYVSDREIANALYNYFNGKYEVDMGYNEEKKSFFVSGIVKT
jgi:hypothetical protein